jgi:hypothetical protein
LRPSCFELVAFNMLRIHNFFRPYSDVVNCADLGQLIVSLSLRSSMEKSVCFVFL